ncbi:MAG: hypothetical protein ACE5Q6_18470 [Dehalococcoidia bacterium]
MAHVDMRMIKSIFAWGLSLAGVFLLVITLLRTVTGFVRGEIIAWKILVALLVTAFLLIAGGSRLAYQEVPLRGQLSLIGAWLSWALVFLGIVFIVRFLIILFDYLLGKKLPNWTIETILAILALVFIIVGNQLRHFWALRK